MRVSSKGQVTLPKRVRDLTGMQAGAELDYVVEGDVVTLRRAPKGEGRRPTRGERVVAAIQGTATANRDLSTDEIMKLLRGYD